MQKVKYKIKIKVMSPFNIDNGQDLNEFVNKYTVRLNGKPYIPASTVKGKIKDNFHMISDINHCDNHCECPMCKIFGSSGYNPSKIYIDNFETQEEANIGFKFGNAIDRYRRVAKDNALYSEEIVHNKEFQGAITVYFDSETINYKEELEMAIKMIEAIGNGKSRGHGRVNLELQEV